MTISHFLSAASHSSTDTAGVDFDWLPCSSIKQWNSELPDSWGDGSLTSPPQPQTIRPPTNNILFHHTFSLLNPSLKTNGLLQQTGSSPPPPPPYFDILQHKLSLPAGDFQRNNQRAESPVSCESSIAIDGMSRACRYSPEEKKERIQRYRSKRNQRNFNKKIKYACRKSLADSRPRIRGRFARYNYDVAKNYPVQWSHGQEEEQGEEEEEANCDDNWIKYFVDAYSTNLIP
ncbi:two-component response regulator-like PRR1 [Cucurbita maxima]|uniref:Two-component response regulator-like PRR1 n=1 Tax=Cucurbita maxima TaxID=3661 RepID=A0A6J1L4M8_CUCMA|nr:two-component response regulator-like PRR1 [Cucurbita maxima]